MGIRSRDGLPKDLKASVFRSFTLFCFFGPFWSLFVIFDFFLESRSNFSNFNHCYVVILVVIQKKNRRRHADAMLLPLFVRYGAEYEC